MADLKKAKKQLIAGQKEGEYKYSEREYRGYTEKEKKQIRKMQEAMKEINKKKKGK